MRAFSTVFALLFFCISIGQAATPETFTQVVNHSSGTYTLKMVKESLRGPHFELIAHDSLDQYTPVTIDPEIYTYLGTVEEDSTAYAAGIIKPSTGEFWGKIYFDRGYTLHVKGNSGTGTRGKLNETFKFTSNVLQPDVVGTTMYEFDVALDCAQRYYALNDSSMATLMENIEYSMVQIRAVYMNDALLAPVLSRVLVHTSDATDPIQNNDSPLSTLRSYWNTKQNDAPRTCTAFITTNYGGGVAYVNTAGGNAAYSVNGASSDGTFDIILRHEMGHNWGPSDNHSNRSEDATVMCGNQNGRFAGAGVRSIIARRDKVKGSLREMGTYDLIQFPPYASYDTLTIEKNGYAKSIAVLANDFDANGDALSLLKFDSLTAHGSQLSVDPNDASKIVVTPAVPMTYTDHFNYVVADEHGNTATGVVVIKYLPLGFKGYEAEDANYQGATFHTYYGGYSGTGYIEVSDPDNFQIEWTVYPEEEGKFEFNYFYTRGSESPVAMQVWLDNQLMDTLSFESTGDWDVWGSVSSTLALSSTSHTIKLVPLGDDVMTIDRLEMFNAFQVEDRSYEAEHAQYQDATLHTWYNGYSGEGYLEIDDPANFQIEWTVYPEKSSDFEITYWYARGSETPVEIQVWLDGQLADTISFVTTGAWETWGSITNTLTLDAESHTIKLVPISDAVITLDRIEITPVKSDGKVTSNEHYEGNAPIVVNQYGNVVEVLPMNQSSQTIELRLYDINSNKLFVKVFNGGEGATIDFNQIPAGIKLLKLSTANQVVTKRIYLH